MLKVVYGIGDNLMDAADRAVEEYNKIEGRKTFHTKDYTQYNIKGNEETASSTMFQCQIWFTVTQTEEQKAKEDNYYIGSTGVDPKDPEWRDKLNAVSSGEVSQTELDTIIPDVPDDDQETAETEWFLNTEDFRDTPVTSQEGSGSTEIANLYSDMGKAKNNDTELPTEKSEDA